MTNTFTDWRTITDEREKYAAYLCSPEWGHKRQAVNDRANGICERCRRSPIDAVHHLTYQRKYCELLTDLQGICNPCHEFTHGKRKDDPAGIGTVDTFDLSSKRLKCPECDSTRLRLMGVIASDLGSKEPFLRIKLVCSCDLEFRLTIAQLENEVVFLDDDDLKILNGH